MNTTSRESSSKTDDRIDKLADQISTLVEIVTKKVVTPATVKAVEESCVICGDAHAYYNCNATDSNQSSVCAATGTYNQVAPPNRVSNQMAPPGFAPMQNSQNRDSLFESAKDTIEWRICSAICSLKGFTKSVETRGIVPIPCDFPVWKRLSLSRTFTTTRMTLELSDQSITRPKGVAEDAFVKVGKFHFPTDFVVVDFDVDPWVPLILGRSFLRTGRALIDVYGEEIALRVNDEAYAQEVLVFSNNSTSGNPTPTSEPIISDSSPSFTPFEWEVLLGTKDVLILIEELLIKILYLSLTLSHNLLSSSTTFSSPSLTPVETSDVLLEEFADELALFELFPLGIGDDDFDPEGDIFLLEKFLNDDPSSPLPPKVFNFEKLKMIKSPIDDFSSVNVYEEKSMTFSNHLFDSNDDFTSSDDESLFDEDIPEDNVKIYSNPLFEFDDEYISSEVNPIFNEELEDIESNESCFSNLDDPDLSVTPLSDANEDECFDPGGVIEEIDAFQDMDISTDIENGDHDSEGDIIYLESLLIDDIIPNLPPEVFLDHDPRSLKDEPDNDDLMTKNKEVRIPFLTSASSLFIFLLLSQVEFESQMEVCSSTCSIPHGQTKCGDRVKLCESVYQNKEPSVEAPHALSSFSSYFLMYKSDGLFYSDSCCLCCDCL
ncbi:reverse transcriptase domain-containing protein [Tanacetum coccineum]